MIAATLRLYTLHPLLFAALALMVVVPYELAVLAITHIPPLGARHESPGTAMTLGLLDVALVGPMVSALYAHAVLTVGAVQRPRLLRVAGSGLTALPVVAAAQIAAALGIAAGLFAFIVPGIVLAVRWAVVAQVAAIERTDWMGALRRSLALTRGQFVHAFAVILCAAVVDLALAAAGSALTEPSARAGDVVLGIAIVTVARSFAALTTALLYFDLLARQPAR
ncbi:MAG TPA: hypothetical protein VMU39_04160 [Solirubrobacteraceae bacterium]|nr:hypothetical protein [Solirubrobacteraceae bacterium]